ESVQARALRGQRETGLGDAALELVEGCLEPAEGDLRPFTVWTERLEVDQGLLARDLDRRAAGRQPLPFSLGFAPLGGQTLATARALALPPAHPAGLMP